MVTFAELQDRDRKSERYLENANEFFKFEQTKKFLTNWKCLRFCNWKVFGGLETTNFWVDNRGALDDADSFSQR